MTPILIDHLEAQDNVEAYCLNYRAFVLEPVILALSPNGINLDTLETDALAFAMGLGLREPTSFSAKVVNSEDGKMIGFIVTQFTDGTLSPFAPPENGDKPVSLPFVKPEDRLWVEWVLAARTSKRRALPLLQTPGPWLHIVAVGTQQEERRKGVAAMMLRWVCDLAAQKQAQIMVEASDMALNTELYEKFGFRKIDDAVYDHEQQCPDKPSLRLGVLVRECGSNNEAVRRAYT